MDRNEAIRVIEELLADRDNDSTYPCVSSPRHYEALDLAIEALGQTESGDCISRQQAIEALTEWETEDMGEVSDGYHTFNQLYHQRAVLFATIVNQNKDKAWKSWKHEDGKFCFDKGGEWFIVGVDTPEGSYTYHYEKKYWDMFDCEELDRGKHWDGHTEEDVTRLLSLPPVTPKVSKDCISRQAAIDELDKGAWGVEWDKTLAKTMIESLPPVTPTERPKGEWVVDSTELKLVCSECKATFSFDDVDELLNYKEYAKFCIECGAKMKGGTENE